MYLVKKNHILASKIDNDIQLTIHIASTRCSESLYVVGEKSESRFFTS